MQSIPLVREYIEQIIRERHIDPDTSEGQELSILLYHELERFTKESVVNALPESKLDEFTSLVAGHASAETLHQFAQNNISHLDQIFFQALQQFRDFYLRKEVTHASS
jgi:hypothetical protein